MLAVIAYFVQHGKQYHPSADGTPGRDSSGVFFSGDGGYRTSVWSSYVLNLYRRLLYVPDLVGD